MKRYLIFPFKHGLKILRQRFTKVHQKPVIVVGNQKSGTTAIAGLLAAASDSAATLDFFFRQDPEDVKRYTEGQVSLKQIIDKNRLEFSRPIIKEPDLTFFAHDLLKHFPDSKLVFIVREPAQNIKSILSRLSLGGHASELSQESVESCSRAWKILLYGESLPPPYFQEVVDNTDVLDVLIKRWLACSELALEIKHNRRVRVVMYEDFLKDKSSFIYELTQWLDLPESGDITHLLDHQFQPKARQNISVETFFGEENLKRIRCQTRDTAKNLGYQIS